MAITAKRHSGQANTLPARVSGALLLAQGLAILGTNWLLLGGVDFETDFIAGIPSIQAVDVLGLGFFFGLPALLAILSAAGLLLRRRAAWLFAMMAEGLLLASSLYYHFYLVDSEFSRSPYTNTIMAFCILMVLYLNTADVRMAFAPAVQPVDMDDEVTTTDGI